MRHETRIHPSASQTSERIQRNVRTQEAQHSRSV
jgi:hypothetical protein